MCQVGSENSDTVLMERKGNHGLGRICMKCENPATVIARINDAFCRDCFQTYFTHRFRATFGKSKVVRNGEKVLIAFSGGQSSTAMLHLVQQGLRGDVPKKFRYIPGVVFIDDTVCVDQPANERKECLEEIMQVMQRSGYPGYMTSLQQVYCIPDIRVVSLEETAEEGSISDRFNDLKIGNEELIPKFKEMIDSVKSLTAKEDLIHILRSQLLIHVARKLGYSKVMLGESSTRLATRILTDVAKGRGATVSPDMAFIDERHEDVAFLRPMREFNGREITMYNVQCGLHPVFLPNVSTKAGQFSSINTLTEQFVNGLQKDFPSTVSTVFRTGEKLCAEPEHMSSPGLCVLCNSLLDTKVSDCSALSAILFSLQTQGTNLHQGANNIPSCSNERVSDSSCCGKGDGSCHNVSKKSCSPDALQCNLCYGCRVTVRDMGDVSRLPPFVLSEAVHQKRRQDMKSEIQDFLLDGDDR